VKKNSSLIKIMYLLILFFFSNSYAQIDEVVKIYKSDFEQIDLDNSYDLIKKNQSFAISSYTALKIASFLSYQQDYKTAFKFIRLADIDAFLEEDKPFYLYIYGTILKNLQDSKYLDIFKQLAQNYCHSYYGYKTYLEIYPYLSEKEKYSALETCLKNRHYEKVKNLLFTLKDENAVNYYLLNISQNKEFYFNQISKDSEFYLKALSKMSHLNPIYEQEYLSALLLKDDVKTFLNFLKNKALKAFYKGDYNSFQKYYEMFYSFNDKEDSDLEWLKFLYYYKSKDLDLAKTKLLSYGKFSNDPFQIEYWNKLIESKNINEIDIKDSYKVSEITPYLSLIVYKTSKSITIKKESPCPNKYGEVAEILNKLKSIDYKLAWAEGVYQVKKGKCGEVYSALPEAGVRCFSQLHECSYVKPFGSVEPKEFENIIYAIMKQESFFNPYAISWSNAVGLTQFIPKTGYYAAKQIGLNDFDMVDLYKPDNAILFAKWYLQKLLNMFSGNLVYVFASYNSGEGAVKRFLDKNNIKDEAEFIEFYPYQETRDYVKKVLRNYAIYKYKE